MAQSTGALIVPISIAHSSVLNPSDWVFPICSGKRIGIKVHVHDPIATDGRDEEDIVKDVKEKLLLALPEQG